MTETEDDGNAQEARREWILHSSFLGMGIIYYV